MLRKLRKHSKPLVMVTAFFFIGTLLLSLVISLLGLFGFGV